MPFPAVTICNMNTVKKSAIEKYPKDGVEYYVSKSLCRNDFSADNDTHSKKKTWQLFGNNSILCNRCHHLAKVCYFIVSMEDWNSIAARNSVGFSPTMVCAVYSIIFIGDFKLKPNMSQCNLNCVNANFNLYWKSMNFCQYQKL